MAKPQHRNIAAASLLVLALGASQAAAQQRDWRLYSDPAYGTSARYPAHVFNPAPAEDIPGQTFLSADGRARLAIGAWDNSTNETPGIYRDRLLADERHPDITYKPRGRDWFVLSGYRGKDIYYEKVVYSCGRRVVNVFVMMYPEAERAVYDPIVERMEDSFRPGKRCP